MHSPRIIGNLCATCLGSRKERSQGSHKLPRKTPKRLPSHTSAPNEQLCNTENMACMGCTLKILSDACHGKNARNNQVKQASQATQRNTLRQK